MTDRPDPLQPDQPWLVRLKTMAAAAVAVAAVRMCVVHCDAAGTMAGHAAYW